MIRRAVETMRRLLSLFLCIVFLMVSPVYALESKKDTLKSEAEDVLIEPTEEEIQSNFRSKVYQVEGNQKNKNLVEGGNDNAINSLGTKQHSAQGSVIESTNVEGAPYDMTVLSDEEKAEKNTLELRQFVSFETKSGKVFHLIIDHSQATDNVKMLTEVGEQDLLNLIEENAEVALVLKQETSGTENNTVLIEDESSPKAVVENKAENVSINEKNNFSLIIIIAASVLSGMAGWYFKIYKPKQSAGFDEEVDEADYIDEEECVE